jgi:deazaflavin-dependent oxidoreductase (nitroreductase family)
MPDFSLFGDEHVRQYEATGGKVGHDWNGTACLILRTVGRKSGQTRKMPLIYGRAGDDWVLVASKGGAPDNPGWYRNLVAHPDVEIQVWDDVIPVRARTATAEEKRRVWPTMTKQWPDYDGYPGGDQARHSGRAAQPALTGRPRRTPAAACRVARFGSFDRRTAVRTPSDLTARGRRR